MQVPNQDVSRVALGMSGARRTDKALQVATYVGDLVACAIATAALVPAEQPWPIKIVTAIAFWHMYTRALRR